MIAAAPEKKREHPRALVAVDVVALTVLDLDLKVLLVERGVEPSGLALPGGFVRLTKEQGALHEQGEDLEAAAYRELAEETRLPAPAQDDATVGLRAVRLKQIGVFGAPDRDPRTRVIAVAYLAVVRPELAAFVRAGSDAAAASWHSVSALAGTRTTKRAHLAFDHDAILARALEVLRRDVLETDVARALVPHAFTQLELRAAVSAVTGARVDPGNFRRRFERMLEEKVVALAPGKRATARRPARVYSFAAPA